MTRRWSFLGLETSRSRLKRALRKIYGWENFSIIINCVYFSVFHSLGTIWFDSSEQITIQVRATNDDDDDVAKESSTPSSCGVSKTVKISTNIFQGFSIFSIICGSEKLTQRHSVMFFRAVSLIKKESKPVERWSQMNHALSDSNGRIANPNNLYKTVTHRQDTFIIVLIHLESIKLHEWLNFPIFFLNCLTRRNSL